MNDPHHINGLLVGLLDQQELEWFNGMVKRGKARRVYEGGIGAFGLAKVLIQ